MKYIGGGMPLVVMKYIGAKYGNKNVKMFFTWYGVEKCPYVVMKYIGAKSWQPNPPQRLSTTLVFDIVITIIWLLLCIISIIIVFLIIDTVCMKLTVSSSLLTQDLNCVMMESK